MQPVCRHRRSWPFVRTPIAIYLIVMLPISGLMLFLAFNVTLAWMKWSAATVLALTAIGFYKGYVRRLVLTDKGPRLVRSFGSIEIPWSGVRLIGTYVPGGGVGATEYVFITTRDTPPVGKWDIDRDTIQLQNRPGLFESIEDARKRQGSMSLATS
ncbi:MAG: hypothetical protein MI923_10545 [Phycisphaerales bacterium]|nr:hypothetical protein [Phycisphaerales bacterium]